MESEEKATQSPIPALICGIWFLLTGWMWTFGMNLVISYPFGILGWFLWRRGRKDNPANRLNKAALVLLVAGLVASIVALFLFM